MFSSFISAPLNLLYARTFLRQEVALEMVSSAGVFSRSNHGRVPSLVLHIQRSAYLLYARTFLRQEVALEMVSSAGVLLENELRSIRTWYVSIRVSNARLSGPRR